MRAERESHLAHPERSLYNYMYNVLCSSAAWRLSGALSAARESAHKAEIEGSLSLALSPHAL